MINIVRTANDGAPILTLWTESPRPGVRYRIDVRFPTHEERTDGRLHRVATTACVAEGNGLYGNVVDVSFFPDDWDLDTLVAEAIRILEACAW